MPPKPSNALVPRGVSGLANKQRAGGLARTGKGHADDRDKHTTSLVLRHGQGGIWQSAEVVLKGGHYSGPQKLAFRANNLIKQGVLAPFQFTQLLNIAWSQCDLNLRTVERLVDYHDFYRDMKAAIDQRPEVCFSRARGDTRDFLKDKNFVATHVAARIHNLFFVASAWRMIWTILVHIGGILEQDTPVRLQLTTNDRLRNYFLVLYDCINDVIEIGKQQVSQLIVASEYYNKYFILTDDNQVQFNPEHIRDAHKSLLTTIMLELALTNSSYPLNILMSSLGDVIADAPKGKHRIGQGLWDAIGDLSVAVDFRGQLDAALTANKTEFKQWFDNAPAHMEGYMKYKEAIELSEEASQLIDSFKDIIYPLEKTENPTVLIKMWKAINDNYAAVAGKNIEALWLLEGAWDQEPRWRTYHLPQLNDDSDGDGGFDDRKRVQLLKNAKRRDNAPRKPRLMIANTAANASDDDDDLPELLDVSDSSEEEDEDDDDDDEDEEDDESDYDEDDMEQLDDLMREAQQYKFESPEDNPNVPADVGDNPFIRMMKGLKGRFASLNPRTKPGEAGRVPDARLTVDEQKGLPKKPTPKAAAAAPPKAPPAPPQASGTKVTVEEVLDEEAGGVSASKKKKKKKKKKPAKKTDSEAIAQQEAAAGASTTSVATPPPPSPSPSPAPAASPGPPSPAKKPAEKKKPAPKPPQFNPIIREYDPSMSLISLSLGPETAQSARSYMAQQGTETKSKVKSRPADAPQPERKSLFSRLRRDPDEAHEKEKHEDEKKTSSRWGLFAGMKKKASRTLRRIVAPGREERGKQSMKWEEFERAMQHMGFTVDGSTAGSSVRFTPPNNDQPITFHKPHPDSTIHPVMLLEFSKRLKEKYGWTEEMFASFEED